MLRKMLLFVAGCALTLIGLVGLVLPVLPGLVFLAAAAACFCMVSPRWGSAVERRLNRSPRCRRALAGWRSSRSLPLWPRTQLAFWLMVRSIVPQPRP